MASENTKKRSDSQSGDSDVITDLKDLSIEDTVKLGREHQNCGVYEGPGHMQASLTVIPRLIMEVNELRIRLGRLEI